MEISISPHAHTRTGISAIRLMFASKRKVKFDKGSFFNFSTIRWDDECSTNAQEFVFVFRFVCVHDSIQLDGVFFIIFRFAIRLIFERREQIIFDVRWFMLRDLYLRWGQRRWHIRLFWSWVMGWWRFEPERRNDLSSDGIFGVGSWIRSKLSTQLVSN